ncbi:hypothetical protein HMPREF9451_00933 [Slackia piriformis YIT 12062]|uniref:Lipoprotein n=1 Tax=Slackia piriformis YIT 12062 TaxID=742818 RepID=K0YJL0_9ACTN|nr:hypothetical protein HMPREF9451_00933 [Slackia piriformis YIT 12062]
MAKRVILHACFSVALSISCRFAKICRMDRESVDCRAIAFVVLGAAAVSF